MDNHATTPVDPRVLEAMMPFFTEVFGNASSRNHSFGWGAEAGVEKAREQIAALIGASSKEIIFTSGATESNNLAIKGIAEFYHDKGNHIITSQIEHKAVIDTCRMLERKGFQVTFLPVDKSGVVSVADVEKAITDKTILISLMHANNEIGTVNPLAEIGKLAKQRGIIFHSDAVQAAGKIPINVESMGLDLVSLTAHKMYGPKGVGALYVRRKGPRVRLSPMIDGGGHERGMRSGTLNVPGIVGMGKAAELALAEMPEESARLRSLRNYLWEGIQKRLNYTFLNGDLERRLPGNLNVSFAYVEGESLLMALKDVAISSGSACTSASLEPSYVLRALGVGEDLAHTSMRFGLGRFSTKEEVDFVLDLLEAKVNKLREMSPLYEMVQEGIDLESVTWAAH